ncbi:MAG: histidinol-phosphatase [candidate division Zixibacteria bacterium]|nr:histidinol-phosphatase [candidate division Zixibacteria bacterium]
MNYPAEIITGCVHIHTTDSDGTQSIEEIAEIANQLGLDFIIVSDHMTLKSLKEGKEGYYGNTLVLIGYEIHDPDNRNHYLVYGLDEILPSNLRAPDYVKMAADKDALGIIAHPDEIRGHLPEYPRYPWTEWNIEGFNGIEIWNHMSRWMEGLKKYNKLKMFLSPRSFLTSPSDRILRIWDEFNQDRKVAGIGSIDVHAFPYKFGPFRLTIFPYKVQFQAIRTHLVLDKPLSRNLEVAKQQVITAIKECRVFISNYRWGDASEFKAFAESESSRVEIGGYANWTEGMDLSVSVPKAGEIAVIRNNKLYERCKGKIERIPLRIPGLYRVEVKLKNKGWIFSNHFNLR